jgi:hypothetical protein
MLDECDVHDCGEKQDIRAENGRTRGKFLFAMRIPEDVISSQQ